MDFTIYTVYCLCSFFVLFCRPLPLPPFQSPQTLYVLYLTGFDLYPALLSLILDFIHEIVFLCYNNDVYEYRTYAEEYDEIIQTEQDT